MALKELVFPQSQVMTIHNTALDSKGKRYSTLKLFRFKNVLNSLHYTYARAILQVQNGSAV